MIYMEGIQYLLGKLKNNYKQKWLTCFNRMYDNRLLKLILYHKPRGYRNTGKLSKQPECGMDVDCWNMKPIIT
jgi:hypothetical protein